MATSLYFAEGYTGPGYQEYLTVLNPADQPATFTVDYSFSGGSSPESRSYQVGPRSRRTIDVNQEVGSARELAMTLQSDLPLAAERPLYFVYGGAVTGGSTTSAVSEPRQSWYFAEGHVGDGFDEYLTLFNPSSTPTVAEVTYHFPSAPPLMRQYPVGSSSRATVKVNDQVPAGDVALSVHAGLPIVVERPMYFLYRGSYAGGSTSTGSSEPGNDWWFAEGYTGPGFDEYLTIFNPGSASGSVDVRYQLADGSEQGQHLVLAGGARSTVFVNSVVGADREVSSWVHSDVPIVAERALYTEFEGVRSGSVGSGTSSLSTSILFAEGYTGPGFVEYLTLQNPARTPVDVTITYLYSDGTSKRTTLGVRPTSRATVRVNDAAGRNRDVAIQVDASGPVVAERTMYFHFRTVPGVSTDSGMVA